MSRSAEWKSLVLSAGAQTWVVNRKQQEQYIEELK